MVRRTASALALCAVALFLGAATGHAAGPVESADARVERAFREAVKLNNTKPLDELGAQAGGEFNKAAEGSARRRDAALVLGVLHVAAFESRIPVNRPRCPGLDKALRDPDNGSEEWRVVRLWRLGIGFPAYARDAATLLRRYPDNRHLLRIATEGYGAYGWADPKKAVECAERLLKLEPDDFRTYYALASAYASGLWKNNDPERLKRDVWALKELFKRAPSIARMGPMRKTLKFQTERLRKMGEKV